MFFCCNSKRAEVRAQIGEKITQTYKSESTTSCGEIEGASTLIKFSFGTQAPVAEFPMCISEHNTFEADHTYSHSQSVYTTDHTFNITLVFEHSKPMPKISGERIRKEFLIEHYDQDTNVIIDQSKRKTEELNTYILDKPLEEYLEQYRHLDGVATFLELYEKSNRVFSTTEEVPSNTRVYVLS